MSSKSIREKIDIKPDRMRQYATLLAAAYIAAPEVDMSAMYDSLKDSNNVLLKRMMSKIMPNFTDDYDNVGYGPLGTPGHTKTDLMVKRVRDEGILNIDTRFSNHNYFSPEENWVFRAVHDYYTHILRGGKFDHAFNFDLKGEFQTYNTHVKLAPKQAIPALFSEVVCQVCLEVITGNFPDPQKSTVIQGFDFVKIGNICFENKPKDLSMGIGCFEDNFQDIQTELKQFGYNAYELYLQAIK